MNIRMICVLLSAWCGRMVAQVPPPSASAPIPLTGPVPVPISMQAPGGAPAPTAVPAQALTPAPVPAPAVVVPAAPAPAPQGLDTVQYSEAVIGTQGNWLKKREWVRQAEEIKAQIDSICLDLQKIKTDRYLREFDTIDNDLDRFYTMVDVDQGAIKGLFDELNLELTQKLQQGIALIKAPDADQRDAELRIHELEQEITNERLMLEQAKLNIQSVFELDQAIKMRLEKLDEMMGKADADQTEATKKCTEMIYMIDDRRARIAYYDLKNILERTKSYQRYLSQDLINDFIATAGKTREMIGKATQDVQALTAKDLIIQNRADVLAARQLKRDHDLTTTPTVQQRSVVRPIIPPTIGWNDFFMSVLQELVSTIVKLIKMPFELLGF